MSYHTGRTSSTEQLKSLDGRTISTTITEKPSGISRALQSLLISPQFKSAGGTSYSPRTVEPLVSSPLRISSSDMASAPSSPERHTADREALTRRSSDQAVDTVHSTTRRLSVDDSAKSDVPSTSLEQPQVKKRFLQARDRSQSRKGVAAIMSGRLFPRSFSRGRDRDSSRASSQRGSSLDARSTPSPERGRPSSSSSHSVHVETLAPAPVGSETGKSLNMHDTFNKSDEALPKPHGSMPDYIKPTAVEEGGERLAKDVFDRDKNMIESSEDEDTSSDEDSTLDGERGRKKKKHSDITSITPSDFEKSKSDNSKQSEEQKASENPSGRQEKKPRKSALKAVVHPQTSFDIPTPRVQSVAGTPYGSEDEAEIGDIHRAQKLGISMSAIDNGVHNRSIRTIVRGNFSSQQDQGDGRSRRHRKYLIATDLSEESVYALEWTIGTVLRDGDTIFAIYAMHEDSTTASAVQVGEGAKAMKDATAVVGTQTKEANQNYGSRTILGRLGPSTGPASKSHSADSRASSIAEAERMRAVETVSQTCVKLLRKTVLQVRIAVEVIHCKNPKSMITEAIDELEPTLVIVGARGQSALKGVLLGSFSNYLLSSSSVPVMVARRKLKRHTWKEKLKGTTNVRLSNNLITPKSLAQAKVD
ncbi:Universal stress protein A [Penicillium vulpinum]|uniref:Universal stress protein A n=1 Tax=Penicillium vulpinum TaxID=29845 RepID=UPI0025467902|nr:Universal stress protein A [Penicillium vulpinum]KAJ5959294.1 Universal stress protein A [Penicillium vulpinum]